jgi:MFS family permease
VTADAEGDAATCTAGAFRDPAVSRDRRALSRVVFASSAGTIFEAYDFILFGSLAPLISRHFFAGVTPTAGFIFTLLTFAAGFVVRPFGALLFGRMGDTGGRKRTFLITISLMGGATFAIGLLPGYATVGLWAPILLIAVRLVQGLAYGGEYGGAVVYTAEHAPPGRRGLYIGWIQTAAGFALFLSFFVIYVTRTALGEESFSAWGWRIPFLISIFLLAISIWIRISLEESPAFRRMIEEGRTSKRPLSEAFLEWRNLRYVLIVLFGMMSVQGVLWYTAHFYTQFFLSEVLHLPGAAVTWVRMLVTITSVFLYVLFSWLSDKIGRKPIMLTGMVLSIATLFPAFHLLTAAVSPALAQAQSVFPVTVRADSATCALQFDPVGSARFTSSCDIARATLARLGVNYGNADAGAGMPAQVSIGATRLAVPDGRGLDATGLAAVRKNFEVSLKASLSAAGYPDHIDTAKVNFPLVYLVMMALVTFSVMVYAPIPAMVVEVFPTRIRYSALSLPYHIGSGWFGGFLPAIAFTITAATGNIYANLWYPLGVTVVGVLVLAFLLPESRGQDLSEER